MITRLCLTFFVVCNISYHFSAAGDKKWSFTGVPCAERNFCGNKGSCTFFPKLQARACNCPDGFEGEHCEFIAITAEAVKGLGDSSSLCSANLTIGIILLVISVISICLLCLVCFLVYTLHGKLHKEKRISRYPVTCPLLEEARSRERETNKAHSSFIKRFLGLDMLSATNSAMTTRRNSAENLKALPKNPLAVQLTNSDVLQGVTRWAQVRRTVLETEISVVDQQPDMVNV